LFSPEGLRVVTSSRDMTAKVWTLDDLGELAGPARVFEAEHDTGPVWSADFSPDGTLLALGLGGGTVQVNPLRGGPRLLLIGHTSDAFRVRFAPDGRSLISGSSDGTARVWNTDFHAAARVLEGDGGRNTALEQRGRVLVSAAHEGSVKMWPVGDAGLGPVVGEDPVTLEGHLGRPVVALDRFPRLLATADNVQPQVRVWPITGTWILDRERPKATLETGGEGVRQLALDGDGQLLAALLMDGTLVLWRLGDTPSQLVRLREYGGTSAEPIALAFSPDGRSLASVVEPYAVALWDRSVLLSATPSDPPEPTLLFEGHRARVHALSFSPDGRRVATVGLDHTARVSNLDAPSDGELVLEHDYFVHASAFDPSGRHLLTACGDTNAYLWDLDAPSQPKLLTGATGEIRDVEFSPDGKLAAAASMDGTLHIWPVSPIIGGEPITFVAGVSLSEVEFVDGGRRIAAAGGEANVWLWYLGENLEVDHLQQQLRAVTEVCPSASERMQFVGESLEVATAASAACEAGG
jgi:WD40 repeat protein